MSNLNRRGFLGLLAGAGAAAATSYFFAPVGGWKSDVIAHAPEYSFDGSVVYDDGRRFMVPCCPQGYYLGVDQALALGLIGNFCNG